VPSDYRRWRKEETKKKQNNLLVCARTRLMAVTEAAAASTIAAIDGLQDAYHALRNGCSAAGYARDVAERIETILAAWPEELL
jgi:hypothetical protein